MHIYICHKSIVFYKNKSITKIFLCLLQLIHQKKLGCVVPAVACIMAAPTERGRALAALNHHSLEVKVLLLLFTANIEIHKNWLFNFYISVLHVCGCTPTESVKQLPP